MQIKEINLTALSNGVLNKVQMVQYDTARQLRCYLDIDISQVTSAQIYIKKPDSTEIFNSATIDSSYRWIDVTLTSQALAVTGNAVAQLKCTGSDGSITTFKFIIEILKSYVSNSAIESTNEYQALDAILATANAAVVSTVSAMTDHSKTYYLTQDSGSYLGGYVYRWNSSSSAWEPISSSGGGAAFVATYGTTTASQIASAITAGKAVICKYTDSANTIHYLMLADATNGKYGFTSTQMGVSESITSLSNLTVILDINSDEWMVETGSDTIPTKTSELTNDSNFVTEGIASSTYATDINSDGNLIAEIVANIDYSALSDNAVIGKGTLDNQLDLKANASDVYTKTATDTLLGAKADADDLAQTQGTVAKNTKLISNIEAELRGQTHTLSTDTSSAYTKDVDEDSDEYALLNSIGGKTIAFNQLVNCTRETSTSAGLTFTKNSSGYYTVSGTATDATVDMWYAGGWKASTDLFQFISGHKYFIKDVWCSDENGNLIVYDAASSNWTLKWETIYSPTTTQRCVGVKNVNATVGTTYTNLNVYPMVIDLTQAFGSGNEPTLAQCKALFPADYYAYNTGTLKSASVDNVVSVGKNLIHSGYTGTTTEGVTFTVNTDGSITISGTSGSNGASLYIATSDYSIGSGTAVISATGLVSGVKVYAWNDWSPFFNGSSVVLSSSSTSQTGTLSNCKPRINVGVDPNTTINATVKVQIEKGSSATTYAPYVTHTKSIPSAIQNLTGYGWSAGSVCNTVNYAPTLYKNMKSVDLGTLTWSGSANAWTTTLADYVGTPLHETIPTSAFSYSSTTLTVATTSQPTGTLHYEATSGGSDYNAYLYEQKVASVNLGDLTWFRGQLWETTYTFGLTVSIADMKNTNDNAGLWNLICPKYVTRPLFKLDWTSDLVSNDKSIGGRGDGGASRKIDIRDDSYTDATTFKTAMANVPLYYELATPRIYDITSLLTDDNTIQVEGNGTITFENSNGEDYCIPVPSSETFWLNLN